MIAKLKVENGVQFTHKVENMMRDIKVSQDLTRQFQEDLRKPGSMSLNMEMTVTIGSSNSWPWAAIPPKCSLNAEYNRAIDRFTRFYTIKHSGRKLIWHHEFGSVDLRARFDQKTIDLNLPVFSATVLHLFEDRQDVVLGFGVCSPLILGYQRVDPNG